VCIKYYYNSLFTILTKKILKRHDNSVVQNHSNAIYIYIYIYIYRERERERERESESETCECNYQWKSQTEWDKRDRGPTVNSTITTDTTHP
jgi:hypothetical protein